MLQFRAESVIFVILALGCMLAACSANDSFGKAEEEEVMEIEDLAKNTITPPRNGKLMLHDDKIADHQSLSTYRGLLQDEYLKCGDFGCGWIRGSDVTCPSDCDCVPVRGKNDALEYECTNNTPATTAMELAADEEDLSADEGDSSTTEGQLVVYKDPTP